MRTRGGAGKRLPAKETLRSNIKDYIQQQIVEGAYRPGDRIVETRLARELNVSQAPVREAILELASIGLLEERPYSGTYVRDLTPPEIEDIFETRAFVEEYAARRAAKRATEEQLADLEDILREMDEHRELRDFVHLDMEFHGLVMDAAGSPALKRAWTVLRMAEWTYISAAVTAVSLDELIAQHKTILRHLKEREEASAGAYMFLHIKSFGSELVQYFAKRKEQEASEKTAGGTGA
ncbi:MAG: GntR family transcriptional regulator [Oscillibacter sp.]|nr:GntR family transcriptional regulator [Oscillibacter sp.]MBR1689264.1 GntR family transcriptional regulator [Oscillibacter sp.]